MLKKIEGLGYISKVEKLCTLMDYTLSNTLVLENSEPFPGYHGSNIPGDTKPRSLFFITDQKYQGDDIIRSACKIKQDFPHRFDATFGETIIQNENFHFIRINNLDSFAFISDLQQRFVEQGIRFFKKRNINEFAVIKLYKHFSIEGIADKVYRDCENPWMFYLEIPSKPDWAVFEKATKTIKQNVQNNNFDAALGIVYGQAITDMVRIFTKELGTELLNEIRIKYVEELARHS